MMESQAQEFTLKRIEVCFLDIASSQQPDLCLQCILTPFQLVETPLLSRHIYECWLSRQQFCSHQLMAGVMARSTNSFQDGSNSEKRLKLFFLPIPSLCVQCALHASGGNTSLIIIKHKQSSKRRTDICMRITENVSRGHLENECST